MQMSKEDYREKIEEDRQEIELEGANARLSRTKRKTKKRKSKLIPTLLVVFIFIPLAVLLYLSFIYKPSNPVEVVEENNDVVQVQKNEAPVVAEAAEDKDKEEEKKQEKPASSEKLDDLSKAEQEAIAAAQAKAAAEAAKAAEQKAKEEASKKEAAEAAKRKAEEAKKSQKTHTVQSNETLYRIAMNYYNDPNAVEKIKQANGLSSESIYVGQTLVLP